MSTPVPTPPSDAPKARARHPYLKAAPFILLSRPVTLHLEQLDLELVQNFAPLAAALSDHGRVSLCHPSLGKQLLGSDMLA